MTDKTFAVRGTANGDEFMRKQDLVDAADASGLSRAPIMYVLTLLFYFKF